MKNKNRYVSRRRTPWDNSKELSPLEHFIKKKYLKNFEFKHPKKLNETVLLNSFNLDFKTSLLNIFIPPNCELLDLNLQ